ncbi:MAG: radical SAM protein [Deltaproteobacteria bacterium]|nr:radical SAM protein [Deltaproteobacteria bacterium]
MPENSEILSLESQSPLSGFDVIAFSVSFEEDYVNIPRILELAGLPVFSSGREDNSPLVMAGGCAVSLNPEPVADFVDVFFIGEAEASVNGLVERLSQFSQRRSLKGDILRELSRLGGVYVPAFYEFTYDGCRVKEIKPLGGARFPVRRARVEDIDAQPVPVSAIITPFTEFADTALIEVERGCPRGCRFCAAGFIYLPPRWRDRGAIERSVKAGLKFAGKAGLVGAAVSEYRGLKDVLRKCAGDGGEITLSSLRLDVLDNELLSLLRKAGYKTVTVAPEAGTERLRKVINKDIPDEAIWASLERIKEEGFRKVKFYFMVGLPTETDKDAEAIAGVAVKAKSILPKGAKVTLSINQFIPKPFTPFQWAGFAEQETIERRYGIIKKALKKEGGIEVKTLPVKGAFLQAYLSRGDRRSGSLISLASEKGWRGVLKNFSSSLSASVFRDREKDEIFPWDVIDTGLKKSYLWNEYTRGIEAKATPPCDVGRCFRCGVC